MIDMKYYISDILQLYSTFFRTSKVFFFHYLFINIKNTYIYEIEVPFLCDSTISWRLFLFGRLHNISIFKMNTIFRHKKKPVEYEKYFFLCANKFHLVFFRKEILNLSSWSVEMSAECQVLLRKLLQSRSQIEILLISKRFCTN